MITTFQSFLLKDQSNEINHQPLMNQTTSNKCTLYLCQLIPNNTLHHLLFIHSSNESTTWFHHKSWSKPTNTFLIPLPKHQLKNILKILTQVMSKLNCVVLKKNNKKNLIIGHKNLKNIEIRFNQNSNIHTKSKLDNHRTTLSSTTRINKQLPKTASLFGKIKASASLFIKTLRDKKIKRKKHINHQDEAK